MFWAWMARTVSTRFILWARPRRILCLILRWINRDNHVADEEFDVEFSVAVGIVTLALRRRVACSAT